MMGKNMITLFKQLLTLLTVAILSVPSYASLISMDSNTFGSNSLTKDTSSGLSWLDLNLSKNYSYDQLVTETAAGGVFEGFRLASQHEVTQLFEAAQLPAMETYTDDLRAINSFINLIGYTSRPRYHSYLQTFGITSTGDPLDNLHKVVGINFMYKDGEPTYYFSQSLQVGNHVSSSTRGAWLVQVPEVATMPLALAGLFILFFQGRRTRNRWK